MPPRKLRVEGTTNMSDYLPIVYKEHPRPASISQESSSRINVDDKGRVLRIRARTYERQRFSPP
jgi:hypothetical protein